MAKEPYRRRATARGDHFTEAIERVQSDPHASCFVYLLLTCLLLLHALLTVFGAGRFGGAKWISRDGSIKTDQDAAADAFMLRLLPWLADCSHMVF